MPGAVLGAGMRDINQVHGGGYYPGRGAASVRAGRVQNTQGIVSGVKWVQEHGQGRGVRTWCWSGRKVATR